MPTFDTGNAQWDQGLSSLGNALFPDPSKAAQGYYYGSEARKAQLQSNTIIDQQNTKNRLMQGVYSRDGSYNTPPPASPTWQQPQNIPNAAPIMAPPSNLPMGPAGGQLVQPTMTPGQAANTIGSILDNHPNSPTQGGTAPPFSSPAPNAGAPPAPTATGSNGSPGPDEASAPLHPNSVASGGGGVVYGGPAAANGSPAPVAVNLGTYVAEAVASGYDAAQAQAMGQATIGAAVQQGRITPQQAHELLATTGQAGPVNADIGARATIGSAQIAANAHLAAQRMVTGETAREYDNPWLTVVGPDGQPHRVPYSVGGASQPGVPGEPIPGQVGPPAPGQVALSSKLGLPMYEPSVANTIAGAQNAFGTFVNPNKPGETAFTTAQDAANRGLIPQATGNEQQIAGLTQQYRMAMQRGDTDTAQKIFQQIQGLSAPRKEITPEALNAQKQVNYTTDQTIYAQPQTGAANLGVKDPVAFDVNAQALINDRTYQLQLQNPRRYVADPGSAHADAVTQLIQEGALQSPTEVNTSRGPARGKITSVGLAGDARIGNIPIPGAPTGSAPADHMMVHATTKGLNMLGASTGGAPGTTPASGTTPAPTPPPPPAPPPTPPRPPTLVVSPGGRGFIHSTPAPPAPPGPGALRTPAPGQGQVFGPAPTAPAPPVQLPNTGVAPTGGTGGGRGGVAVAPRMSTVMPAALAQPQAPLQPAGTLPPGALAAAPGAADGSTGTVKETGQRYVVRGGFAYPMQ